MKIVQNNVGVPTVIDFFLLHINANIKEMYRFSKLNLSNSGNFIPLCFSIQLLLKVIDWSSCPALYAKTIINQFDPESHGLYNTQLRCRFDKQYPGKYLLILDLIADFTVKALKHSKCFSFAKGQYLSTKPIVLLLCIARLQCRYTLTEFRPKLF